MNIEKHWIVVRDYGGICSVLVGERSVVDAEIDRLNRLDDSGSTELLSGPFTEAEAKCEFDRLNA